MTAGSDRPASGRAAAAAPRVGPWAARARVRLFALMFDWVWIPLLRRTSPRYRQLVEHVEQHEVRPTGARRPDGSTTDCRYCAELQDEEQQ